MVDYSGDDYLENSTEQGIELTPGEACPHL